MKRINKGWLKKWAAGCLTVCVLLWSGLTVQACTLWGAAGNRVEEQGTLLVKNRDWLPNHRQELRLVRPESGWRFYGLYAVGGNVPGLKMGVNEKGLTVITATVGTISEKDRKSMAYNPGLMRYLLTNCSTVEEALLQTARFGGPEYLMLADSKEIATVEVGPKGTYAIKRQSDGTLCHTNHYVEASMEWANYRPAGESSQVRYDRIQSLLEDEKKHWTVSMFQEIANDQHDGPDNSIWRIGSTPKKTRTLATWIVSQPAGKEGVLYVKLANPGEAPVEKYMVFSELFPGN